MKPSPEASLISVVSPALDEAQNLPLMYQRLSAVFDDLGAPWEWIVADDHSTDQTSEVLESLVEQDSRVRSVRFSRRFGSHVAIISGLHYSRGECVVVMAADLQDPPEEIPRLVERWKAGAKVVWAIREKREGESIGTKLFSRLYHLLLRSVTTLKDTPPSGADMWLMDRHVVDAVNADPERHSSVTALVRWMGFTQDSIYYAKAARQYGKSKWSVAKKITHAIDTLLAFTALPIRLMTYVGLLTALVGSVCALIGVRSALLGSPVQAWIGLVIVTLLLSGSQMLMLGVLGEYLWRTYEESRQRPRYIVERLLNIESADSDKDTGPPDFVNEDAAGRRCSP